MTEFNLDFSKIKNTTYFFLCNTKFQIKIIMNFYSTLLLFLIFLFNLCKDSNKSAYVPEQEKRKYPVIKTNDGIVKKVVITKTGVRIYNNSNLNNIYRKANQWDIFYIHGYEKINSRTYVLISESILPIENPYYVSEYDVFEWNNYFTIARKNSAINTGREPIQIYRTLDDCKNEIDPFMQEGEEAEPTCNHVCDSRRLLIVLKDYGNSIYKVAIPVMKRGDDDNGAPVFTNELKEGFVRFSENAYEFRRYVNKSELREQFDSVLKAQSVIKSEIINPNDLDLMFNSLSSLLTAFTPDYKRGVNDIASLFKVDDMPQEVQEGLFNNDYLHGQNIESLDETTKNVLNKIKEFYNDDSVWDEFGRGFILKEW